MQIPPWLEAANMVIEYKWQHCEPPYQLWVKLLLPIASETAYELIAFDWTDIVRAMFKPKGLRSGRHGRKKRGLPGIPEIPELVVANSEEFEAIKARRFGLGESLLWEMDELEQRVAWELGLLEITNDFIVKSVLATLSLPPKKCEGPGRARITGEEDLPFNNGQTYDLFLPTVAYQQGNVGTGPDRIYTTDGLWQVIGTAGFQAAYDRPSAPGRVVFFINGGPDGAAYEFDIPEIAENGVRTVTWAAVFRGPADVGIAFTCHGGVRRIVDGMLTVWPEL
jgi:hypothetical protein